METFMRKAFVMLSATLSLLAAAAGSSFAQRLVTPLGPDLEALVSDFNGQSNVPRLLVILSPT
jgi:hypothetical protein